jgi:hypothetical protein
MSEPDSTRGRIRIHKAVKGIPRARVQISIGETDRVTSTVIRISALDSHDFPEVVATLRMSPADAAALGERLILAAKQQGMIE